MSAGGLSCWCSCFCVDERDFNVVFILYPDEELRVPHSSRLA